jgi:hypothetical protein
MDNKVKKYN